MNTFIKGFKEPDETWFKMKAVWDSCVAVCIDPPKMVGDYFNWEAPTDAGMQVKEVDLGDAVVESADPRSLQQIWTVDLTKLPEGITKIQFTNSY